uniref:Ammonium_transp domain-containing protein n=1 Tax=Panagrellus redivivus TaxID=6233 RepID=A0A7E4ZUJ4_PANRE
MMARGTKKSKGRSGCFFFGRCRPCWGCLAPPTPERQWQFGGVEIETVHFTGDGHSLSQIDPQWGTTGTFAGAKRLAIGSGMFLDAMMLSVFAAGWDEIADSLLTRLVTCLLALTSLLLTVYKGVDDFDDIDRGSSGLSSTALRACL